ncbi:MAG: YciI family protein [Anaerolineales bacterium]|nr:YciI family protein [Anaerolineales bacterium]
MAKYLLVFSGGAGMGQSDEEVAALMAEWGAWYESMGDAVVDPGHPTLPMAKSIAADRTVTDGPSGTMVSGYAIINADSLDAATEMAKGCPVLDGPGTVDVFETFPVGDQVEGM